MCLAKLRDNHHHILASTSALFTEKNYYILCIFRFSDSNEPRSSAVLRLARFQTDFEGHCVFGIHCPCALRAFPSRHWQTLTMHCMVQIFGSGMSHVGSHAVPHSLYSSPTAQRTGLRTRPCETEANKLLLT